MTILKMKLTANTNVYIFLLFSIDLYFGSVSIRGRSVAASAISPVIASVGSKKELSCTKQTSNPPKQVSWYRIINEDARRCPNQTYIFDGSSVFCDRLTNNRIVQPGFGQRFSVPGLRTENENGLIITSVELSDFGTYACVDHNNSKVLARINFTAEEAHTAPSIDKNWLSPTANAPVKTPQQEIDTSSLVTDSSSQSVDPDHHSLDVSTIAAISVFGAAIVSIIVTIVFIVLLKIRKLKEERVEVGPLTDVVSGNGHIASDQFSNNTIELDVPVYAEIKENEMVARSTDRDQSIELSPVYDLLRATDGDESNVRSAVADVAEVKSDRKTSSNDSVQDQTNQNAQAISIYGVVNSDIEETETSKENATFNPTNMTVYDPIYGETTANDVGKNDTGKENTNIVGNSIYEEITANKVEETETSKENATFNPTNMTAYNPIYGEITENDDTTEADATYQKVEDIKKTTVDDGLCSNPKTLQPKSPNVGLDGTVYLELIKCNESGVPLSVQQPKQQLFEKSIYAGIDHNEKPPPAPPPSIPRRSACAPPR